MYRLHLATIDTKRLCRVGYTTLKYSCCENQLTESTNSFSSVVGLDIGSSDSRAWRSQAKILGGEEYVTMSLWHHNVSGVNISCCYDAMHMIEDVRCVVSVISQCRVFSPNDATRGFLL